MKQLERADVFIMNGAGMEGYIEEVAKSYPNLKIIDASEGIPLLSGSGHSHDHSHDEETCEDETHDHSHDEETCEDETHDHSHDEETCEDETHDHSHDEETCEDETHDHSHDEETCEDETHDHDHESEYNSHYWMDPDLYTIQINTIKKGLENYYPAGRIQIAANATEYQADIELMIREWMELKNLTNDKVIIFHDSMEYLMNFLDVEVVYSVGLDGDAGLSAGEVAHVIELCKSNDIKVLLTEVQFDTKIVNQIAKETNATIYEMDSIVSGEYVNDAYITAMRKNLDTLKLALYE